MIIRSKRLLGLAVAAFGLLLSFSTFAADDIPWKNENFESTRVNSELSDVLRSLVRQNGQNVDFRPGVEGNVTFDFNMPLQEAFNRLVSQNGLVADYNSTTNVVTIGPYRGPRTKVFYTPSSLSLNDIRDGIERFGMDGETQIIFDDETKSLLITGDETSVEQVAELVENLDQALIKRQQTKLEQDRQRLSLQREEQALKLEEQRSILELKRLSSEIDNAGPVELKVIPLKYASVGPTQLNFMNEEITVPGIDETLGNILGTQVDGAATSGGETSSMLIGNKAVISMDLRTNSVIVRGTAAEIAEVEDVIERLDQPLPMIEIEVMVVQASDEIRGALGVQYALGRTINNINAGLNTGADFQSIDSNSAFLGDRAEDLIPEITDNQQTVIRDEGSVTTIDPVDRSALNDLAGIFPSAEGIVQQISIPNFGDNAPGTTLGSIIFGGNNRYVQATISALESEGLVQTLAAPRIVVLNNVTAKVARADTLNVQIRNNQTGDVGFEGIQTGLQLEITPSIIPDGEGGDTLVRLTINASNSALSGVAATQNATSNDEVQTQVIIPDTATFMLGGLFSNTRTELRDGIPVLNRLPLVGGLFGSRSSVDVNEETLFFITPRILDTSALVSANGESLRKYLKQKQEQVNDARMQIRDESLKLKLKHLDQETGTEN